METQKKRRGDRKDGRLMRELDSLHYVTGILYPNRCDNEAYISQRIDLTNMNAYIAKKNETETEFPYTMFHLVLAALMKTITLRPKLNRFIVNSNFYQRNEVSASFVVKKQFSDKGAEALAFLHCKDEYTLSDIHDYIRRQVTECRSDKVDPSTGAMDILNRIPRFVSKAAIHLLMWLDKHGWVPARRLHPVKRNTLLLQRLLNQFAVGFVNQQNTHILYAPFGESLFIMKHQCGNFVWNWWKSIFPFSISD